MFTKSTNFHAIRSRQKVLDFPITSRSVLVNFSLGPRSSLVRLSLLSRQSIEDRSRTERGTSEKRTKEQRTSIEKIARNYRKLDEMPPSWLAKHPSTTTNRQYAFLPQLCRGRTLCFLFTLSIFEANKAISSIPWVSMV